MTQVHLGIVSQLTWNGGSSYKRALLDLPNLSPVLIIDRDTGSGRVRIGSNGLPKIYYWPNAVDRDNLVKVRTTPATLPSSTLVHRLESDTKHFPKRSALPDSGTTTWMMSFPTWSVPF